MHGRMSGRSPKGSGKMPKLSWGREGSSSVSAKPMIDRLLQATAAFRQRHATHQVIAGNPAVDEAPLTDLAFAQALKKLRYVEGGRFIIGKMRIFFDDRAEKYDKAGDKDKAKALRMIANSLRETETTIKTFVEIEQERSGRALVPGSRRPQTLCHAGRGQGERDHHRQDSMEHLHHG